MFCFTNPTNMSFRISDQKNVPITKGSAAERPAPSNETLCCVQFSFESCLLAIKNNHIDCLIRAHRAGCPLGKKVVQIAEQLQHTECWMYAKFNVNTAL